MKARVKATGEVFEIASYATIPMECEIPDYWTRLEHQYAGMAMQGMIRRAYEAYCDDCANYENMIFEDAQALLKDHAEALADVCVEYSHALVEKLKNSNIEKEQ